MVKTINICRCCLAVGCYKDISSEYYWAGKKEIYDDMLRNTLNIEISFQEGAGPSPNSRLICDTCIQRLRDATEFKTQVLNHEENFKQLLSDLIIKSGDENINKKLFQIKDEDDISNYELVDKDDHGIISDKDDFDVIKGTKNDEADTYNEVFYDNDTVQHKPCSKKNHNDKADDKNETVLALNATNINKSVRCKRANASKTATPNGILSKTVKPEKKISKEKISFRRKVSVTSKTNLDRTKEKNLIANSILLVQYSKNAVLFNTKKSLYQCFMCKKRYVNLKELREHTLEHSLSHISSYMRRISTYRNIEISHLKCKICDNEINNLDVFRDHLIKKHKITSMGSEHLLIPYKVENEMRCVVCSELYSTMTSLKSHMRTHYANNVCETCGISFIYYKELYDHIKNAHKPWKCPECGEIANNASALTTHRIKKHNRTRYCKRYCLECNDTFKYTYQLNRHKIEKHGDKVLIVQCEMCDKRFNSKINLNIHKRSVHLKERDFACELCPGRFFTKCDLNRHLRSHASDCQFGCDKCSVKFKSKDSLRRHLKKQHGG